MINSFNFVLLHGKSGHGKSSLVNAGVIPKLAEQGIRLIGSALPDPYLVKEFTVDRSIQLEARAGTDFNYYEAALLHTLARDSGFDYTRLADYLIDQASIIGESDDPFPGPCLVIIDQFERIFRPSVGDWHKQQREVMASLQEAVDECPNLRILFVVRDEQLADAEYLGRFLNDGYTARMHLDALSIVAAFRVIRGPRLDFDLAFAPGVQSQLLRDIRIQHIDGRPSIAHRIEPLLLQVALHSLWETIKDRSERKVELNDAGSVQSALKDHYETAIESLTEPPVGASIDDIQDLRLLLERRLIDPSGAEPVAISDRDGAIDHRVRPLLDALEDKAIVRKFLYGSGDYWELTHQALVPAVVQSNEEERQRSSDAAAAKREAEAAQLRLDAERLRNERDDLKKAKWRKRAFVTALFALAVLAAYALRGSGEEATRDFEEYAVSLDGPGVRSVIDLSASGATTVVIEAVPLISGVELSVGLLRVDGESISPQQPLDTGPDPETGELVQFAIEPSGQYRIAITALPDSRLDGDARGVNSARVRIYRDEAILSLPNVTGQPVGTIRQELSELDIAVVDEAQPICTTGGTAEELSTIDVGAVVSLHNRAASTRNPGALSGDEIVIQTRRDPSLCVRPEVLSMNSELSRQPGADQDEEELPPSVAVSLALEIRVAEVRLECDAKTPAETRLMAVAASLEDLEDSGFFVPVDALNTGSASDRLVPPLNLVTTGDCLEFPSGLYDEPLEAVVAKLESFPHLDIIQQFPVCSVLDENQVRQIFVHSLGDPVTTGSFLGVLVDGPLDDRDTDWVRYVGSGVRNFPLTIKYGSGERCLIRPPDVRSMSVEEARTVLENASLSVAIVSDNCIGKNVDGVIALGGELDGVDLLEDDDQLVLQSQSVQLVCS